MSVRLASKSAEKSNIKLVNEIYSTVITFAALYILWYEIAIFWQKNYTVHENTFAFKNSLGYCRTATHSTDYLKSKLRSALQYS